MRGEIKTNKTNNRAHRLFENGSESSVNSEETFDWEGLPDELKLEILSFLKLREQKQFSRTSRRNLALAKDKSLLLGRYESLYKHYKRYTIPSTPHNKLKEHDSYKQTKAFKHLYFSLPPKERILIDAAIMGDRKTLINSIKDRALRNRLLIIAACQGDKALLGSLGCKVEDIDRLALVNFSTYPKHRQDVLDYFWSLVKSPSPKQFTDEDLVRWAVMLNQPDELTKLLEKNQTLASKANQYRITPHMIATYYRYKACTEILEKNGATPTEITPELIKQFNGSLIEAVRSIKAIGKVAHLNSALILLANGAIPDYQNISDRTAILILIEAGDTEALRFLLPHVVDVNVRGRRRSTALIHAVAYKNTNAVSLLLEYNANPNLKNTFKKTALDEAARMAFDTGEAACLLTVAMFLKPSSEVPTPALVYALSYAPDYFHPLIKNILNGQWPWVTEGMELKLLAALKEMKWPFLTEEMEARLSPPLQKGFST